MRRVVRFLVVAVIGVLAGCTSAAPVSTVEVLALAGPTCPVVSDPPDPACADRPVADAQIVVRDADGSEVAWLTTDAEGNASVELAPGTYVFAPEAVDGLMGSSEPVTVVVVDGVDPEPVTLAYDTGIR
jgi:hypothetical protein